VFAIERRNHSKTALYGDLCALSPVDTPFAADRMEKRKKSLDFDGFDDRNRIWILASECPMQRRGLDTRRTESSATRGKQDGMCGFPSRRADRVDVPEPDMRPCGSRRSLAPASDLSNLESWKPLFQKLFPQPLCDRAEASAAAFASTRTGRTPPEESSGPEPRDFPIARDGHSSRRCTLGCRWERHSLCSMYLARVGMTACPRKNLRGEDMRRRRNERT